MQPLMKRTVYSNAQLKSLAAMKDLLSDGGVLVSVESDGERIFLIRGIPYASLRIKSDMLIVQFKMPKFLGSLRKKLSYYCEVKYYEDSWLEFRAPANDDYTKQLDAELGAFVGQVLSELL